MSMEHLDMKWSVAGAICGVRPPRIIAARETGETRWMIADGYMGLPNDKDGLKTMEHICNLHNAIVTPPKKAKKEHEMTTQERIEVMQAYQRGEHVQFISNGKWIDMVSGPCGPAWSGSQYRIKPKQKCRKVSVSLFDSDINKIEAFRKYAEAKLCTLICFSTAVRLYVRLTKTWPDPEMIEDALTEIRNEDGRSGNGEA